MAEDIFGKKEEKPEEKPATGADELKTALETISSLKGTIDSLTSKIDEIETTVADLKVPPQKEEPPKWQPKTWDEFPEKAKEVAEEVVETKLEETKEEEEAKKRAEEGQKKQIDQYLDTQVTSLETSGFLPKVENPNDENDKGKAAKRELFGLAARLGTMDLTKAAENLDILHKTGYTYDPRANNFTGSYLRGGTLPGTFAPVSAPGKTSGLTSTKPSYETIHKRSMGELVKMAMPE